MDSIRDSRGKRKRLVSGNYWYVKNILLFHNISSFHDIHTFVKTEIGAVLFDLDHYGIIDSFQQYVRPTRFPWLSEKYQEKFPTKQSDVDGQPNIQQALQRFYKWLDTHGRRDMMWVGGSAFICTWFSKCLGEILPGEAAKKRMSYRKTLNSWIDMAKVVRVSQLSYVFCLSFLCSM